MKARGDLYRPLQPIECPDCGIERRVFAVQPGVWPPKCLICTAFPSRHRRNRRQRGYIQTLASTVLLFAVLLIGRAPFIASLAACAAGLALTLPHIVRRFHKPETIATAPAPRPVERIKAQTRFYSTDFRHFPARAIKGSAASSLLMPRTCTGCGKDRRIFSELGVCLKCTGTIKEQPKGAA